MSTWSEAVDPASGRTFYFNAEGETSWEPPASELPPGWAAATDPASGRTFYFNAEGETSWEVPETSVSVSYCYVDDDHVMQGPFEQSVMRQWYEQSLFPDDTLVCVYGEPSPQYHRIGAVFGGAAADGATPSATTVPSGSVLTRSRPASSVAVSGSAPEAIEKVVRTLEGLKKIALVADAAERWSSAAAGYKVGWLVKRARKGKGNWRRRHCTLSGEKLTYAESEGGKSKGFIAITAATEVRTLKGREVGVAEGGDAEVARFFSVTGGGEEDLVLQAASPTEARSWVGAVGTAVRRLKGKQGGSSTFLHLASEASNLETFVQGMECDKGLDAALTERISALQRRCANAASEVQRAVEEEDAYAEEARRSARAGVEDITMSGFLKRRDQGVMSAVFKKADAFYRLSKGGQLSKAKDANDVDNTMRKQLHLTRSSRVQILDRNEHVFEIAGGVSKTGDDDACLIFQAKDADDLDRWVRALCAALDQASAREREDSAIAKQQSAAGAKIAQMLALAKEVRDTSVEASILRRAGEKSSGLLSQIDEIKRSNATSGEDPALTERRLKAMAREVKHLASTNAQLHNQLEAAEAKLANLSQKLLASQNEAQIAQRDLAKASKALGAANDKAATLEAKLRAAATSAARQPMTRQGSVPPPPPAAASGPPQPPPSNPRATAGGGVSACDDPVYGKFIKMLKMRVPRPAVENKMRAAGLDVRVLDHPDEPVPGASGSVRAAGAGASASAGVGGGATAEDDPTYAKFFKMLKMRVPRPAVENKMRAAGLDPSVLDNPTAPPPAAGGRGVGSHARPAAAAGPPVGGGRGNLLSAIQAGKKLKKAPRPAGVNGAGRGAGNSRAGPSKPTPPSSGGGGMMAEIMAKRAAMQAKRG